VYTYNILSCFLLKQSNYPKLNDLSPLGLPFGVQTISVQSMANAYMEEYDIYQNLSKHCGIFFGGGLSKVGSEDNPEQHDFLQATALRAEKWGPCFGKPVTLFVLVWGSHVWSQII
jgi:hypothetical protein